MSELQPGLFLNLPEVSHFSHRHRNTTTQLVQEETKGLIAWVYSLMPFAISSYSRILWSFFFSPVNFLPWANTNVQEHFPPHSLNMF